VTEPKIVKKGKSNLQLRSRRMVTLEDKPMNRRVMTRNITEKIAEEAKNLS
jgi:hypothetical protein